MQTVVKSAAVGKSTDLVSTYRARLTAAQIEFVCSVHVTRARRLNTKLMTTVCARAILLRSGREGAQ